MVKVSRKMVHAHCEPLNQKCMTAACVHEHATGDTHTRACRESLLVSLLCLLQAYRRSMDPTQVSTSHDKQRVNTQERPGGGFVSNPVHSKLLGNSQD